MAKVDRKTLDKVFNDLKSEIEDELSELYHWDDDWTGYDVEPQDYAHHFDDGYDWRNEDADYALEDRYDDDLMCFHHDYDSGDL